MRLFLMGVASAASFASVASMAQIPIAPVTPLVSRDDPNVIALYTAILSTIGGVPATAASDQFEAQIAYTVDQSQANCRVVLAALREALDAPRQPRPAIVALRDVLTTAARCNPYGTAAVGGAAGATLAQGPAVGVGGGTSNYSRF